MENDYRKYSYSNYDNRYDIYREASERKKQNQQNKENKENQQNQQVKPHVSIKIDKKGKSHEKNQSMNYGFIGSTSSNKYSNPYDAYGDFTSSSSKKEKRNSKKEGKKRISTDVVHSNSRSSIQDTTLSDIDVTQTQMANNPAVPLVYYPQQITTTIPAVYYTTPVGTPVGTPVAIQYVNSPTIAYQEGSNSSESEHNKEKVEGRKFTSYYGDKENVTDEVKKKENKEQEYEEIMNELGIKPKKDEPKTFKEWLLKNQLVILIGLLILFVILIILYFIWPRLLDIELTEFELLEDGIHYKLPFNIENRESYIDLTNVTSSDLDSFVQFDLKAHFNVKNDNFIPYKFNNLFLEYNIKDVSLPNSLLIGKSFVDSIYFKPRGNARMGITTSLSYSAPSAKNDDFFSFILAKCGITQPGSPIELDYKVTMSISVIPNIYHPTYIKTFTQFECPFLTDDKYKVVEKKKKDDDDDDKDKKNKKDNDNNSNNKNKNSNENSNMNESFSNSFNSFN